MVPFKSSKICKAPNSNQDLITNLPEIAIDKILKRLPIKTVAQMSILSKKWRDIWLSLKYLVFDRHFWDELKDGESDNESEVGVKKISLFANTEEYESIPPSIFHCKDLVKLELEGFDLNHTLSHFKGFAYLRSLNLNFIQFEHDIFRSLIAKCPQLKWLTISNLESWIGSNKSLVIDSPVIEHLTIQGYFETIVFKNIWRLRFVSLFLDHMSDNVANSKRVDHFIKMLASSCQLRDLHYGGQMFKYFGAGSIAMSPTLKFLHRLRLTDVNLSDFNEFCFILDMLQCCPFIRDLYISVHPNKRDIEHKFDYNKNFELKHLVEVKVIGLTGSRPQLKLIEYLFSVASKLEKLAIKCDDDLDLESKLKMTQDLSALPRASPKAKLVCL